MKKLCKFIATPWVVACGVVLALSMMCARSETAQCIGGIFFLSFISLVSWVNAHDDDDDASERK